jgi:hypothetical protein
MYKDHLQDIWLPIQLAPESCDLQLGMTEKTGSCRGNFRAEGMLASGSTSGAMNRF